MGRRLGSFNKGKYLGNGLWGRTVSRLPKYAVGSAIPSTQKLTNFKIYYYGNTTFYVKKHKRKR